MALRNQPYIPLYVQDFMTDEKLNECSAGSTGVYIRLMCIMHKSDEYGVILLKQKDKQNSSKIKNFACKLGKQMPYDVDIIESALEELVEEKVLIIDEDKLIQKRMVNDNNISEIRAKAGKKGGEESTKNRNNLPSNFAQAKHQANTEVVVVVENEDDIEDINIFEYIESNYGRTLGSIEFEMIEDWSKQFTKDIIKYAVKLSILSNVKTFAYVNGILNNWKSCSYKTLQDIIDHEPKKQTRPELNNVELFDYNWLDDDGEETVEDSKN